MSRIRSKNTKAELILRKAIWAKGCRYRLHYKIAGKPDLVFVKRKLAVFIDGCFWHKCPQCYVEPKSNSEYWIPKIEKNVQRDQINTEKLKNEGWTVLRFWEHEIMKNLNLCLQVIINHIEQADTASSKI